jgi:hypothetical protein
MSKPFPQDVIAMLFKELSALPDHARLQITAAHCYLELFVHLLVVNKCKNAQRIQESSRDYPQSVKIVLLHEAGLISDKYAEILHWFRKKRNEAAHQVDFSISAADLTIFRGMKASDRKTALDDPKNVHHLCIEIVVGFWNAHVGFFAPLFMPELFPPPDPFDLKNRKSPTKSKEPPTK